MRGTAFVRVAVAVGLAFGLLVEWGSAARAAELTVEGDVLKIDGEIRPGDEGTLATILAQGDVKTVSINSPGGDLGTGLKMGEQIRKAKLTTFVEAGVREAASAAAYIFMGGTERIVKGPRGVGVHAFFTPSREVKKMVRQKSGDELVATLNEFERRTQESTMAVVEYVMKMVEDVRIVREAVKSGSDAMTWPDANRLLDMKVATKLVEYTPDELPDGDWVYEVTVAWLAGWLDPSRPDAIDEGARAILERYLADEDRAAALRRDIDTILERVNPPSRAVALDRIVRPLTDQLVQQAVERSAEASNAPPR